jgi:hypothetical protein
MRRSFAATLFVLLASTACGTGEGGTITVPCEEARCNETCVADGNDSGSCRDEACVCRPAIDIPGGPTHGLSSGGLVQRRSGGYQVSVSVGPVAPVGDGLAGDDDVELGVQPQTDPERLSAP